MRSLDYLAFFVFGWFVFFVAAFAAFTAVVVLRQVKRPLLAACASQEGEQNKNAQVAHEVTQISM
jgi:hypothetical protein